MDSKAEYLSEICSDPFEYLRQLRQTTEPIGGSTEYTEDGELVEYDVAIEAVKKTVDKVPTWKKVGPDVGQTILYMDGAESYLERFGYRISLNELDKLPKENNL